MLDRGRRFYLRCLLLRALRSLTPCNIIKSLQIYVYKCLKSCKYTKVKQDELMVVLSLLTHYAAQLVC